VEKPALSAACWAQVCSMGVSGGHSRLLTSEAASNTMAPARHALPDTRRRRLPAAPRCRATARCYSSDAASRPYQPRTRTSQPDKARRNELLRHYRDNQRAAVRQQIRLGAADLSSRLDFLDGHSAEIACNRTLHLTHRWAQEHSHNVETLTAAVQEFGGYCDCESSPMSL
jgi:hypothetical protein